MQGKVAIVTGAGGGIGKAYAKGLAEAGAAVVLADINLDNADTAAKELTAAGHQAFAVRADVADEASVNAMASAAAERFGSVDILVNNAALMAEVVGRGTLTTMPLDLWERTMAVNLTGPLLCVRAVLPHMKERGYGKIVNQSSGGAFMGANAYGISKLGVVSMTLSLARELAPFGIRVNAIAPGYVNTEAGAIVAPPAVRAVIEKSIPFPFGDPEELVPGLLYLVGPGSDWVTGHTLNIDGGWIPRT
ncbi:NAD(P)-dependent dehydrogenase, short-chain alcohol dehydrogenase family [Parafrankia irregularis]|uniref:NAD(P)-dependent dehydrogenase, short-chain alcohol dehydrogenase family n=1 Tax=Parafrankia irregularis TaxID=795642 RepID=A0A0S4QTI9_9ACTN|nr:MULTISPECIES: SDR family oxidoreductase [Parafrankia]CUU58152.1 NAD(P)-dependent dehydrogenase, short-chain alcohol dehydrogenase family [Parafrankia irregularis]